MEETRLCPQCGSPLAADAPQGICPKCLLATGIASRSGIGPEGASTEALRRGAFEPLGIEELARLFPQLEILELVGCGGMGAVYKARQRQLDRIVALKILPPSTGREAAFNERFAREARAMAKLFHPHIVLIFDFGQSEGVPYFIMEFVDGVNLRQATRAGRLSPEQALAIVPQICEALQYAHDAGVVHRDIKPENILLDRRGQVKIADFGLAKLLGQAPSAVSLTGSRQAVGTPHYMAPEQIENPQIVDHRADIYALGVVFYEMLTGELPIGRFAPPSAKGNVDARLDDVVHKTLEKEPERRYQHASEIKTDVDGINAPLPDSYVFRWANRITRNRAVRRVLVEVAAVWLLLQKLFDPIAKRVGRAARWTIRNGRKFATAAQTRTTGWRDSAQQWRRSAGEAPESAAIAPASLSPGWSQWAAEWRAWAARTLKLLLLGAYLFCLWCFFSVGGTEAIGRGSGASEYVHTVGSPEPWLVIENQKPTGWSSKVRLFTPTWLLLAGGLTCYYIYWRIRRAELGGRGKIRLIAAPVLHGIFWSVIAVVAVCSGADSVSHENIMRLPFGLSMF
ncbi:MAG TPA: serine/threonine-protein kinase [Pirellulales bacterium]|nr:serine/threonine-protein kinase [Pirellulales bacterium]